MANTDVTLGNARKSVLSNQERAQGFTHKWQVLFTDVDEGFVTPTSGFELLPTKVFACGDGCFQLTDSVHDAAVLVLLAAFYFAFFGLVLFEIHFVTQMTFKVFHECRTVAFFPLG